MIRLLKSVSVLVVGSIFVLGTSSKAQDTQSNDINTQDRDVLWFDESFKIMTCDLETTDSKCIGDPKSPLCVVETLLASGNYEGDELLRIASGEIPGPPTKLKALPYCGGREGYRVVAIRHFMLSIDIPHPNKNVLGIRKGDVAMTLQVSPGCKDSICPPPDFSDNLSYILRKGQFGWYRIYGDNRNDLTDRNELLWNCPGWPKGWTEPGPMPEYCPDPPK